MFTNTLIIQKNMHIHKGNEDIKRRKFSSKFVQYKFENKSYILDTKMQIFPVPNKYKSILVRVSN